MGLFGVNKKALRKWPQLSPEDAALCWKAYSADDYKHLSVALEEKRYAALAAVDFTIGYSSKIRLLTLAYQKQDLQAFQLIKGMSSSTWDTSDQNNLFSSIKRLPAWPDGFGAAFSALPIITVIELFDLLVNKHNEAEWPRLMAKLCLVRREDVGDIIAYRANCPRAMFDILIDILPMNGDMPSALAKAGLALLNAKGEMDPYVFDALLAKGMNTNHDKGALLIAALKNNHIVEAQKLMDADFNLDLVSETIREVVYSDSGHPAAIEFIERYVGKRIDPTKASKGFILTAPDTVVRKVALPDGGCLTIAFNFTLQQQITIAQMNGQVSAPTSVPFNQLDNRAMLQKVAAAFVAAGGDEALSAIDSGSAKVVLGKAQLQAGG